ncbi:MAG: sigma-54-dependent Fis family transcriptional regulator [Puniceicoccaceae bacterium]|nr:MAG: sigma-54-dependent Fis family transcriptional regulator [Puniceicoccaceae bacterium]
MSDPEKPATILVIDDDSEIRYSLKRVLNTRGFETLEAGSGEDGIKAVKERTPSVVFLDIRMGGMGGLETLQHLRAAAPQLPIILMTAYGTAQTAIEAMKYGAFDYLMKPFDSAKVLALIEGALKAVEDRRRAGGYRPSVNTEDYKEGLVGNAPAMQEVFKTIGQVAASDATVLISGESGTGKELIARCIVQHSLRARGPFVAVNCAAIPDNLIESELFGHEKGSFTGATAQRIGKFELCDRGTIFLDEIGDMVLPTQTKILRMLQEGELQRVGGTETIKVDVRIIAATNKDLEAMVKAKTFREDLYYRLNVVRVRVPPLRERAEDIPAIVDYILQKLEKAKKARVRIVSPEAMEMLVRHRWPGNVRELENVIYRSAVVTQGDAILIKDLPEELRQTVAAPGSSAETAPEAEAVTAAPGAAAEAATPSPQAAAEASPQTLLDRVFEHFGEHHPGRLLEELEREMVRRAIARTGGNQAQAALLLGMTRNTLKKRLDAEKQQS